MTTLDARELYRRASAEFTARVHRVGDRWTAPTPCGDWDVRALVRHLVEEERWAPPLLGGATVVAFGDVPGQEYVMQIAADHLVHAWDLGQALGDDSPLDADAVATVREWFGPVEPLYRRAGVIGQRAVV